MKMIVCAALCACLCSTARPSGTTEFLMISSPDSSIASHPGTTQIFTDDHYQFKFYDLETDANNGASLRSGLLEIDIEKPHSSIYYSLIIQLPVTGIPQEGLYLGATRWPFETPGSPGLDFSSNAHGYNQLDGWLWIRDLDVNRSDAVTSLAIDFGQYSDDYGSSHNAWEFGSLRFNSCIPVTTCIPSVPEPGTALLTVVGFIILCPLVWARCRRC